MTHHLPTPGQPTAPAGDVTVSVVPAHRRIFQVLREAGFVRAGRYTVRGRSVEGWLVLSGNAHRSFVHDTICRSADTAHRSHLMEYASALAAAGFVVTGTNRGSALEVSW